MNNKKIIKRSRNKFGMTDGAGRSMVEMLGVLAIVGVLSAGALKGYSAAMFKHKMNQTIDITTKMFQRHQELVEQDLGGNEEDMVWITSDDGTAVQNGLLEKCDLEDGYKCRLPVGSVYVELVHDPYDLATCGVDSPGHYGLFNFYFTDAKSCTAFASVHWEQMFPTEWWKPRGNIGIFGEGGNTTPTQPYIYNPTEGVTTYMTTSEMANACQTACAKGNCHIEFVYRYYC